MPNRKRQPRRPRAVARRRFVRGPRSFAPGGFFYRTHINCDPASETTIGTVFRNEIVVGDSNSTFFKQFTQFKIHRVGVRVFPLSYMEYIVRGQIPESLNTRKELLLQGDLKSLWVNNGKARMVWFKPNQSVQKFWIDTIPTGTNTYTSGLHIAWTGQNQLDPATASGLLFQTVFDITFQGPLGNLA